MIFISLRKFMLIDMAILIGIGIVCEWLALGILFKNNTIRPAFIVSFAVILTCLARWGIKGLVSAPILAVFTWLGGKLFIDPKFAGMENVIPFYTWEVLVAMIIGNLTLGVGCLFYRKKSVEKVYNSYWRLEWITLMLCFFSILMEALLIPLLSCGSRSGLTVVAYDLIGVIVTMTLVAALKSQGIYTDVKQKMQKERQQALEDAQYEKEYMERINRDEEKK